MLTFAAIRKHMLYGGSVFTYLFYLMEPQFQALTLIMQSLK
jgi:hypothetical protein